MTPHFPSPAAPAAVQREEPMTEFERKILRKIRRMREHRRNCLIVIGVEGSAIRIFDAAPSEYITEN